MSYCTDCHHNIHRKGRAITNKAGFCRLRYTQNPLTHEAATHAIAAGAHLCDKAHKMSNQFIEEDLHHVVRTKTVDGFKTQSS